MINLLEVKNLTICSNSYQKPTIAVDNISLNVGRGQVVGLVGESGSGKSITCLSLMGLLPSELQVSGGEAMFGGVNLYNMSAENLRALRGRKIAIVFQDPMSSLNPVLTVGFQINEALCLHGSMERDLAQAKVFELLSEVGLLPSKDFLDLYPHELSGGQRQRVVIAMALAGQPELLIADEPTTALDTITQKQILDLLMQLKIKYQMSILFITHDLSLVKNRADYIYVMKQGSIVDSGTSDSLFENSLCPYTQTLVTSFKTLKTTPIESQASGFQKFTILKVKNLQVHYSKKSSILRRRIGAINAVDGVDFSILKSETVGLVGGSGCGKSTVAKSVLQLIKPTNGQVYFNGDDITQFNFNQLKNVRKKIQIIFQDPYASLNPHQKIRDALTEPMAVHGIGKNSNERADKVIELMRLVSLDAKTLDFYPHQFSGGQRQRIAIARALSLEPELLVLDEAVSSLDVTVRLQILQLLKDLKDNRGLSFLFISHDLALVRFFCDRILVMENGKIIEEGLADTIYANPQQPFTQQLVAAIP